MIFFIRKQVFLTIFFALRFFYEYLSDLYIEKLSSQWWTPVGYLRNRGKNLGQCAIPWSFQYFGEFFYLDFGSRSDSPSRVKIYFAMILAGRRFRPQCRNTSFYFALIRSDRKKFCDESRLDLKICFFIKFSKFWIYSVSFKLIYLEAKEEDEVFQEYLESEFFQCWRFAANKGQDWSKFGHLNPKNC